MAHSNDKNNTASASAGALEAGLDPGLTSDSSDVSGVDNPDRDLGRLPWLCVAGSAMFLVCTFGFMQGIGTIQVYIQLNQLNDYTTRDIGWIVGLYTSLSLLLGLQAGPLMDRYGPRLLAPASAAMNISMVFLLAECTQYWHFMLCLGLLGGIGAATTTTVAISTISKLFTYRHGAAMGCAFSGSCLGGVFFPLILQAILPKWGWTWSIRVLAFIVTGLMVGGCLCYLPAARLIVKAESGTAPEYKASSVIPNLEPFRSLPFTFITLGYFLLGFAMFGINGLLPTFANRSGFTESAGYTLVALSNGFSLLGRLLPGIVSDYIGCFNVLLIMVPLTFICTASLFVPLDTSSIGPFYAFACLWGFGSGCIGKTCRSENFGRYYGEVLETSGHTAASGLFLAVVGLGGISVFVSKSLLVGSFTALTARA
ncbi:conserved hypothetical protein [Verticillium alfalfae VaMs.102]|uniref:Major facilitator superfamily (MFS) profile domain-containing protein n=1 Tax=Verticillium alfalfae (strain VaMs.102 / ATCC MYA-4576 / FGSC 10136) TaxID=526221 RepID=C9SQL0_VERA1|nr:conserved hypothetical protein [Verticillium alfalfae VaMs.102]EEY21135.1 conserved hypothetical protein [Verticillium alfalfae VaMs.102]